MITHCVLRSADEVQLINKGDHVARVREILRHQERHMRTRKKYCLNEALHKENRELERFHLKSICNIEPQAWPLAGLFQLPIGCLPHFPIKL